MRTAAACLVTSTSSSAARSAARARSVSARSLAASASAASLAATAAAHLACSARKSALPLSPARSCSISAAYLRTSAASLSFSCEHADGARARGSLRIAHCRAALGRDGFSARARDTDVPRREHLSLECTRRNASRSCRRLSACGSKPSQRAAPAAAPVPSGSA
eukprot:5680742-Pleurochrysis_carterae.AAC.1